MKVMTTPHGFQSVQFTDETGKVGIAEQCGGVDYANPTADQAGSSYLLLGRQDAPVQLNMEQVGELVEYLEKWLEYGCFVQPARHKHGAVPPPHQKQGSAQRR